MQAHRRSMVTFSCELPIALYCHAAPNATPAVATAPPPASKAPSSPNLSQSANPSPLCVLAATTLHVSRHAAARLSVPAGTQMGSVSVGTWLTLMISTWQDQTCPCPFKVTSSQNEYMQGVNCLEAWALSAAVCRGWSVHHVCGRAWLGFARQCPEDGQARRQHQPAARAVRGSMQQDQELRWLFPGLQQVLPEKECW